MTIHLVFYILVIAIQLAFIDAILISPLQLGMFPINPLKINLLNKNEFLPNTVNAVIRNGTIEPFIKKY